MGLSEVNQVLTLNRLRHNVTLRTDGGIKTGRDVVIAAMLGAEAFGAGTASLIAMGCIMVRQCHPNTSPVGVCVQGEPLCKTLTRTPEKVVNPFSLIAAGVRRILARLCPCSLNNPTACPVGVGVQDDALRKKFTGTPEKVVNLFSFMAEEVREILARLGARSLNEIIGRTDLLKQVSRGAEHLDDLDLNPLLVQAETGDLPNYCTLLGRNEVPETLDAQIIADATPLFEDGEKMQLQYSIRNTDRKSTR